MALRERGVLEANLMVGQLHKSMRSLASCTKQSSFHNLSGYSNLTHFQVPTNAVTIFWIPWRSGRLLPLSHRFRCTDSVFYSGFEEDIGYNFSDRAPIFKRPESPNLPLVNNTASLSNQTFQSFIQRHMSIGGTIYSQGGCVCARRGIIWPLHKSLACRRAVDRRGLRNGTISGCWMAQRWRGRYILESCLFGTQ